MPTLTPFVEDSTVHELAETLGLEVVQSRQAVEIYDEDALVAAGYVTKKPKLDFGKIVRALQAGCQIDGARFKGIEYVLRPAVEATSESV